MTIVHNKLHRILRAFCVCAVAFCALIPISSYGNNGGYDCDNGGDFPMYFGGCRAGYYYEDWQNADSSITPEDVGECIECPIGYNCAGGFAGPAAASPCAVGYYGETLQSCAACTNKPAHSSYIAAAATNNCPWQCDDGYGKSGNSCVACDANQFSVDGTCQTTKFSITTTSNTTSFGFYMSAAGTFYVDWGDGTYQKISRSNRTSYDKYEHNYSSSGTYTIRFAGVATGYSDEGDIPTITFNEYYACYSDCDLDYAFSIASISGSLGALFPIRNGANPVFNSTFAGATNLTSIPSGLFSDITTGGSYMFKNTFWGCTGLTSIPENLFSNITTGEGYYMFRSTFSGCTGLTSIPSGLFNNITTGASNMFGYTFYGCTGLTSIPSGLFSNITTGASNMFASTFEGCTNLAGYIPPTTFAGLIAAGHPTESGMWSSTFYNTQLATSCPAGTTQYITGYEGYSPNITWGGRVSCGCPSGKYGDGITCTNCTNTKPANSSYKMATNATCPWECDAGYYGTNSCTVCTNTKPANSSYTGNATTNACPWQCNDGYGYNDGICGSCAENEFVASNTCQVEKFSVTTTNDATSLSWTMSAKGTFYVNCGDGGVLSGTGVSGNTITRTNTNSAEYSCRWSSAGAHTIKFGGVADTGSPYSQVSGGGPSYAAMSFFISNGTMSKISSVSGSLGALFPQRGNNNGQYPRFGFTFHSAINLTSIPAGLFSGLNGGGYMFYATFGSSGVASIPSSLFSGITTGADYMFYGTFNGCTGLTSIPGNLFSGITTGANSMFSQTFYGCAGLTSIPGNLFSGITSGAQAMFSYTFYNCTGLTSIPGNLFGGITTGANSMFSNTFNGCTGLTEIPGNLFGGITTGASSMFNQTFQGCTGLTEIPGNLFGGITTGANSMFSQTFYGCAGLTSIPGNLFSGITTGAYSMFGGTFRGCTGLTGIPAGLFSGITTAANYMFNQTFLGCTGLTSIPGNLFSGITTGADYMFYDTFNGCTGLTSIPAGLFSGITTGATSMFSFTFRGCTGLTSIPGNLFSGITTVANSMFYQTFYNCTNLAGYIPPTTFAGLIAAGHPTASGMWASTFYNTKLATSCPAGNPQYITGYEGAWSDKVSCGCAGGQYINNNGCSACDNSLPSHATWDANPTTSTCPWTCDAGYIKTGSACESAKFSVTTTSDTTSLVFTMTATGTFYVNCGDGGALSQSGTTTGSTISGNAITRTGTDSTTYTCTWGSAGAHTVQFAGTATNYSTGTTTAAISFYKSSGGTQAKIASVSGNLSSMFPYISGNAATGAQPRFYQTFYGATNLAEISNTLFSNYTTGASYMFRQTFYGCTGLTSIPGTLFSNITTGANSMFSGTFRSCTGLQTIPGTLFSNITTGAGNMFNDTFSGCTGLQTIPGTLFSGITTGASYMFYNTFKGCTGLTSIPGNLFSGITTGADGMFDSTFYGCTGLTSIPGNLFSGITIGAEGMFGNTFQGCTGLTSIPATLFSGITTGANSMFFRTFRSCTGLTSIPGNLFSGITTGAEGMFNSTFNGCTGLTSIPGNLFSGITTGASSMFSNTFNGCTNLAGYIPPGTFAGLIAAGHPTATSMWYNTFTNTNVATSCASYSGTTQYITGYEGSGSTTWGGRVSCKCANGYYGDTSTGTGTCSACSNKPSNSTYTGNATTNACPWACDAGYYGSSANGDSSCTICPAGYACSGGVQTNCADSNGANGRPQYSVAGASSCTECPAVSGDLASRVISYSGWWSTNIHNNSGGCYAYFNDTDNDATFYTLCYYNETDTAYGGPHSTCQVYGFNVIACAAGKYMTINTTTEWLNRNDTSAVCDGVDCMRGKVCTDTDPGYYSPAGDLTQTQCSAGTFSAGGATACTTCTGATYSVAGASSCSACPAGYTYNTTSGKTLATQCQANCVAETYISDTIPTEYTQLEYIQSDGNQYINTGYACGSNGYRITGKLRFVGEQKVWSCPMGVFATDASNAAKFGRYYDSNRWTATFGTDETASTTWTSDTDYEFDVSFVTGNKYLKINDQTIIQKTSTSVITGGYNIYLFAYNRADVAFMSESFKGRLYGVRIYDDTGSLVRDFVPVRRNSDSVVGMYDNVTDVFFANAGTGNFTAGPDATSVCTNVGDGYWSAGGVVNFGSTSTRTACTNTKPTNSHYSGSAATNACPWACDTDYVEYANACHGFCPTNSTLHIGTLEYPVFADRTNVPSPVMNTIDSSGQICHIFFAPNGDNTTMALKVLYNDVVYRAIDPR